MARFVYADNAATTAVSKAVLDEMIPYFCDKYGNPSSIYSIGQESLKALDQARKRVADAIGAAENEIYFTSGGSEADNWAIKGVAHSKASKGKHLITTKFEHHAIMHTMKVLEKEGYEITYLDVNNNGVVNPADLEKAIRPDTILVTIMYANNEIGTIQPIPELAEICKKHGVIFHTDAVQAVGHVKINVHDENIDMLSMSGHKFHGPKGTGALYIKNGLRIPNLIEGGAQEKSRRAGTENVPGIVGIGKALELAVANLDETSAKVTKLRDKLIAGIEKIPLTHLNGDREKRLPGNANFSFEGVEGESLLLMLDMNGICASSGSACASHSLEPSHVLLSIGVPVEIAHGSLRFSLGDMNTEEDVDYILEVLPKIVSRLREMSPVWEDLKKEHKI